MDPCIINGKFVEDKWAIRNGLYALAGKNQALNWQ
jgi:hypothetical protein